MGIHPADFSWKLESEESFYTPEAVLTFSAEGLGKMTRNFHDFYSESFNPQQIPQSETPDSDQQLGSNLL